VSMVVLRTATEADVAFLTDVAVWTLQDQGRWPADEDEATYRAGYAEWTREQIRGEVPDSTLSVLELDGVGVGRLRVVRPGDLVEIAGLQVLPAYQGRGVGSEVVTTLAGEAGLAGLPLELGVEDDNPRARALYERLGLTAAGEVDGETRMRLDPPTSVTMDP
jgi:ribosomal protein S18 acetylase RimI-like enzyme